MIFVWIAKYKHCDKKCYFLLVHYLQDEVYLIGIVFEMEYKDLIV